MEVVELAPVPRRHDEGVKCGLSRLADEYVSLRKRFVREERGGRLHRLRESGSIPILVQVWQRALGIILPVTAMSDTVKRMMRV